MAVDDKQKQKRKSGGKRKSAAEIASEPIAPPDITRGYEPTPITLLNDGVRDIMRGYGTMMPGGARDDVTWPSLKSEIEGRTYLWKMLGSDNVHYDDRLVAASILHGSFDGDPSAIVGEFRNSYPEYHLLAELPFIPQSRYRIASNGKRQEQVDRESQAAPTTQAPSASRDGGYAGLKALGRGVLGPARFLGSVLPEGGGEAETEAHPLQKRTEAVQPAASATTEKQPQYYIKFADEEQGVGPLGPSTSRSAPPGAAAQTARLAHDVPRETWGGLVSDSRENSYGAQMRQTNSMLARMTPSPQSALATGNGPVAGASVTGMLDSGLERRATQANKAARQARAERSEEAAFEQRIRDFFAPQPVGVGFDPDTMLMQRDQIVGDRNLTDDQRREALRTEQLYRRHAASQTGFVPEALLTPEGRAYMGSSGVPRAQSRSLTRGGQPVRGFMVQDDSPQGIAKNVVGYIESLPKDMRNDAYKRAFQETESALDDGEISLYDATVIMDTLNPRFSTSAIYTGPRPFDMRLSDYNDLEPAQKAALVSQHEQIRSGERVAQANREFQTSEGAANREFQASEGAANREFQASEGAANREFQASEGAANRESQQLDSEAKMEMARMAELANIRARAAKEYRESLNDYQQMVLSFRNSIDDYLGRRIQGLGDLTTITEKEIPDAQYAQWEDSLRDSPEALAMLQGIRAMREEVRYFKGIVDKYRSAIPSTATQSEAPNIEAELGFK